MRQNPHVRICGGPGSATTLVYPTVGHVGPAELGHGLKDFRPGEARASALLLAADGGLRGSVACDNNLSP